MVGDWLLVAEPKGWFYGSGKGDDNDGGFGFG